MKYKVTMEWVVDVPEDRIEDLKKAYPRAANYGPDLPKQLAAFMAMDAAVSALVEHGHPDAVIHVEPITN